MTSEMPAWVGPSLWGLAILSCVFAALFIAHMTAFGTPGSGRRRVVGYLQRFAGRETDEGLKPTPNYFPALAMAPNGFEAEVEEMVQEASVAPSPDDEEWYVRGDDEDVVAEWIPAYAVVGPARHIVVRGDVGRGALLVAIGGGARIEVMGSVHPSARISARGGGAHVLIYGPVAAGVQVYADGGGAKVEFLSESRAWARAEGGGAEVIHHDSNLATALKPNEMNRPETMTVKQPCAEAALAGTPADPDDLALLQMFKGAKFSAQSRIILPSGQSISGQQARELTEDS
ncbi:Uncharacterised protein [Mycobacteroides abscessus subsp. abscessus]|nr:hypothetical protein [Mycobacteroides abscessus]SIE91284.1 Uncharacterised protein [Mycobacteroides abscessus subsp. abscessus]SLD95762.1 Uncharacterised protein [Mycobacteroides abscessus subsp. massiliense]SIF35749.1 Uncharacterised protein [Mycobacteroides abscessus subsp. abscessus]SIF40846.1 Uncharacterised protein [Mycobacteroides abscessus subsp. abscessus]